jgi:hypothetical protein
MIPRKLAKLAYSNNNNDNHNNNNSNYNNSNYIVTAASSLVQFICDAAHNIASERNNAGRS